MEAPLSLNEPQRLEALDRYKVVDTPNERDFDDLARLAARICETPISLLTLVDRDRQWFKGRYGVDMTEAPRHLSFCSQTILHPEELMEVPDAAEDPRFADHELVTGPLRIRYYLGAPLVTPDGYALGSLCVLDKRPRTLTADQKDALRILSRQVMTQLELRRRMAVATGWDETQNALQNMATIVADSGDAVIAMNLDGIITSWNPGAERLFGYSADQMLGKNIRLTLPPDRQADEDYVLAATQRGARPEHYESKWLTRDGHLIDVSITTSPICDSKGAVVGVSKIARDISNRKQAEAALKESEERFQQIAEAVSHVFWIIELAPERVLYVSPAFERIWGLSAAALYAHPRVWIEAIHPEDRPQVQGAYEDWLKAPERASFDVEYRVVRPDGSVRWIFDRGTTVRGADGRVRRLTGVAEDITERKRAEQALRESEQRFRALTDNMSQFAWMADKNGWIFWFNHRWFDYTGTTLEEMQGWGWQNVLHRDHVRRVVGKIAHCFQTGEPWEDTFPLRGRDGEYRWFLSRAIPIRDDSGSVLRWFGTHTDITELKNIQDALRESEERFRTLFETSPISTFLIDPQTKRIIDCNDQATQSLGYNRQELRQLCISDIDVQHTPQDIAHHAVQIAQGLHVTFETRHRTRSGDIRDVLVTARSLQLQGRRVLYVTSNDITETKRAQEALRDNEARLRLAIETVELGSYERNLITNEVIANQVCRKLLGFPEGPVPPDAARKSVHPDDKVGVLAAVDRAYNPDLREICSGEFRIVTPEGIVHWVYGRGRVLFDDQKHPPRPYKFHGVLLDITSRKQAEAALQRRTFHLQLLHQAAGRLLLGQSPVELLRQLHTMIAQSFGADIFMLYQADPNNGHLRLEACAGVTDEQRHRLETLRYGLAICAKSAEALQPIIATHIQDREAPNRRFVRRLGFRSYLYYPLVLNNRLHGTIAFASRLRDDYDPMDLDFFQTIAGTLAQALERRRLEAELQRHAANLDRLVRERTAKLEEAMAELEHMSYSMVHDMRAPLRAMETFATLAEEVCAGCARPEGLDYFHRIRESTRRLDRLVTDALNYNRVLREELPTAPVQLKRLLQSIIDTYPDLSSTVAEIHLDFEERCILGNESLLTQCFGNLLGNAVKFVAPGVRPRVRVWGACPPNEPSKVLVWVEDNGIGIPKEAQGRIFQMFQRMHRESEYPGTGIGLTIAKKAVERMGGRIGLKSEPGQGTRFWVELPLASS